MRIHSLLFSLSLAASALGQTIAVNLTAAPGTVDFGPGYLQQPAWLYGGTLPGQVIRATAGQTLHVHFRNLLPETTTVHFHGQPSTLGMDGMLDISRPGIAPGQEFRYELRNLVPGTYWFHPHNEHHHAQLDRGLYGVLLVDPANPADDPASDVDQVIVLDDWSPTNAGGTYSGHLLNGRTSLGQTPIVVTQGQKLRLRFVNVAAATNYTVALDGHTLTVTHTDGCRIQPLVVQAVPIGMGERYDVLVDCNNPGAWSLAVSTVQNRTTTLVRGIVRYAGSGSPDPSPTYVPPNLASGALADYANMASYWPAATPITTTPTQTVPMALGMTMGPSGMLWTINGEAFPNVTPWTVAFGDIVQVNLTNTTMGMNHLHPMHLHGHFVQLLGTAGGNTHPVRKDTVLMNRMGQPGSSWSVQFRADNPGRWLYHCHDLMHMMNGMMTLVDYTGDHDADGRSDIADMEPTRALPVLTIPDHDTAFTPGAMGHLGVQWQPNQWVQVYVALQGLAAPVPWYGAGDLWLPPNGITFLQGGVTDAQGVAMLHYMLPADPALSGFRCVLQTLCGTTLPGGMRLGTDQAFSIR